MSWRDRYQAGSFRGVPFKLKRSRLTFGRRKVVHEYAKRDDAWAEDMGKKIRTHHLELFVIGDDYFDDRDALIEAIEQEGPGILVHPYFGRKTVDMMDDCVCIDRAGEAKISVTAVESGTQIVNTVTEDTVEIVNNRLSVATASQVVAFEEDFTIDDQPSFVSNASITFLENSLNTLKEINGTLTPLQNPFSDAAQLIDDIQNELVDLIQQPGELATSINNVFLTLFNTGNDIDGALAAYRNFNEYIDAVQGVNVTTPAREQESTNQSAMQQMSKCFAVFAMINNIISQTQAENATLDESPFNSFQHTIAVRDEILDGLGVIALTESAELYDALSDLGASFIKHIERHGASLTRVVTFSPKSVQPALVLAHQLYGDASREQDIVARNNIADPNFVPSDPLEVLAQ